MLGLSANIKRTDGLTKVLHWFLGPAVVKQPIDTLIERPEVQFIEAKYQKEITVKINYKNRKVIIPDLINKICDDPVRNKQIADVLILQANTGRKIILLSDRREHCNILKNMLESTKGFEKTVGLYLGSMVQDELNKSVRCDIILATYAMASEGFDVPELTTLVLASPKTNILQSVGRILRQRNVFRPLIIDIADKKYLLNQFRTRVKFYNERDYLLPDIKIDDDLPLIDIDSFRDIDTALG
jgi:superfamily II DNA or RNA helicase